MNTEERIAQYTVIKNAINTYTPLVRGFLHDLIVAERSVEDREKILTLRSEKKTRFFDEENKKLGVTAGKDIGTGEWVLEMTGKVFLDSEVKDRAVMTCGASHHLYQGIPCGRDNESICMAVWMKDTIGMYIRRSCQPTCQLVHHFGTELHLVVEALKPLNGGDEVTLAHESDCLGSQHQLKCAEHEKNPDDCPMEQKRLLRKAQNENPAAYSLTVTLTESGEEETIVALPPNQPLVVEEVVVSNLSSDSSARSSPEAPESPLSEVLLPPPQKKRRENEKNPIKVPSPASFSVSQRAHLHYSPPSSPQPQQPRGNFSPKAVLASEYLTNIWTTDRVQQMAKKDTPLEKNLQALPILPNDKLNNGEGSDRAPQVAESDEVMHDSTSGNQGELDEPPRAVSPLNNVDSSSTISNMVHNKEQRTQYTVALPPIQPLVVEEVVVSNSSSYSSAGSLPEAPESPPSEALLPPSHKKRRENEQNPIEVPPPASSSVSRRVHLQYSPPPSPQPQQPRGNLSPKAFRASQCFTNPWTTDRVMKPTETTLERYIRANCQPDDGEDLDRDSTLDTPLERYLQALPILPNDQLNNGEGSDRAPQVAESDEVMDDSISGNQGELDEPPRAVSPLNNVDSSSTSSNSGVRQPRTEQLAADERAATRRRGVAEGEAQRKAAAIARRNRASTNRNSSKNNAVVNECAVVRIVGKRITQRGIEYQVKWEGWPEDSNTWEPLNNLNCKELVDRYEKEKKAERPRTVARRALSSTSTQSPRRGDQSLKKIKTVEKENGDLQFNCEMRDGSEKQIPNSTVYGKYGTKAVQFFDQNVLAQMEEGESRP
ncbi:hypothetical protein GCK72_022975 [Caenorhabditis remanei]|uniref:Chromo domain-containing protein n=1 Tax=Caenorhabditis remanei TaxID=31234 RepID=A0A6A5FVR1_CAERE|nr:hypothetical protein GCK72_022975 [Caenorhabditis remanei]KAF1746519.1 hypothetical protein GCK72_022975 [Caenorhabditis remanei]